MIIRSQSTALLTVFFVSLPAWGQAALSPPSDVATPTAPASAPPEESLPAGATPADRAPRDPAPLANGAQEPPAAAPSPEPATSPADIDLVVQPGQDSPYITKVGKQPSPRDAFFVGLGLGGGRIQDSVTGFGGAGLALDLGYSLSPALAVLGSLGGFFHSKKAEGTLSHLGGALGVQAHVADPLRFSVGFGYYSLSHAKPDEEEGGAGSELPDGKSLGSIGGEGSIGFDFFRSPGGFTVCLDLRNQLSFPDGHMVNATYGLIGVRWYGIGRKRG
jgi:hypothetical protein